MVMEKKDNSRSGKSQGISPQVRENLICWKEFKEKYNFKTTCKHVVCFFSLLLLFSTM